MIQCSQGELFEVVAALHPPCGLARRLHRRQQQRDQYADDRNHHQQLDQCETGLLASDVRLISSIRSSGRWTCPSFVRAVGCAGWGCRPCRRCRGAFQFDEQLHSARGVLACGRQGSAVLDVDFQDVDPLRRSRVVAENACNRSELRRDRVRCTRKSRGRSDESPYAVVGDESAVATRPWTATCRSDRTSCGRCR